MIALRQHRWVILPCVAICLLATIPIAAFGNYRGSIEGFLDEFTATADTRCKYSRPFAWARKYFGLCFSKLCRVRFTHTSSFRCSGYSACDWKIFTDKNLQCQISSLTVIVASALFLIPVHVYDLVSLTVILMLIVAWPLSGRWLMAIGLLLCLRPDILLRLPNIGPQDLEFAEIRLLSGGLLFVFVGAFWSLRKALGSQAPSQNS